MNNSIILELKLNTKVHQEIEGFSFTCQSKRSPIKTSWGYLKPQLKMNMYSLYSVLCVLFYSLSIYADLKQYTGFIQDLCLPTRP